MIREKVSGWARETFPSILVFLGVNILLTLLFFKFTGQSVQIGTLRPESSIAPKIAQLALVGLGVGLVASLARRKLDTTFLTLGIAFTVLLDFDHLPSIFGMPQPIRPDHSVGFIAVTLILLYFVNKKRPEIVPLAAASFMAHLAADTGIFGILAPFSFHYYSLAAFKMPLAISAVALAVVAGHLAYLRAKSQARESIAVEGVMNRK